MLQAGLMASLIRWNWMHQNYLHYEISFTLCWQNFIIKDSFPTQKSGFALLSARTSRTPPPRTRFTTSLNEKVRNSNHIQEEVLKMFTKGKSNHLQVQGRQSPPPSGGTQHDLNFYAKMTCIHVMHNLHQTIWQQTFKMIWLNIINHLGSLCPFETF